MGWLPEVVKEPHVKGVVKRRLAGHDAVQELAPGAPVPFRPIKDGAGAECHRRIALQWHGQGGQPELALLLLDEHAFAGQEA